jgi:hypothetical protein
LAQVTDCPTSLSTAGAAGRRRGAVGHLDQARVAASSATRLTELPEALDAPAAQLSRVAMPLIQLRLACSPALLLLAELARSSILEHLGFPPLEQLVDWDQGAPERAQPRAVKVGVLAGMQGPQGGHAAGERLVADGGRA